MVPWIVYEWRLFESDGAVPADDVEAGIPTGRACGRVGYFRIQDKVGAFVAIQPEACASRLPRNMKVNTKPARNPPMCAV